MEHSPSATLRSRILQQRERLDRFKSLGPNGIRGLERDIGSDGSDASYDEVPSMTTSELYNRELDTKSRIKSNWEALIERLSKYGEDEQGDVLDINTLEVVVDKGHLKSLSEKHDGHIWHEDFDDSREDKNRKSRIKYNLLKKVREAPERDDLMLLENRPTSSERLRSRVLQNQRKEFHKRPTNPEFSRYQFQMPPTARRQSLSSGIDSLSIVSPSRASTPGSHERLTSTMISSRAAVLRKLLIQRAKSRSDSNAPSVSLSEQKNSQEVPSTESPGLTYLSEKNNPTNFPLEYNSNYLRRSLPNSVSEDSKIADSKSPDPDSDSILKDIVSKVDGMRIAEGSHVSFLSLIEKLKKNDKRLSMLIEKYGSDEDVLETPYKKETILQQKDLSKFSDELQAALYLSVISVSSDEFEDENTEAHNVEFVRPPISASTQQKALQKYYELMETQEHDEIQSNEESFFSIDEDEPSHDSIYLIGEEHQEYERENNIEGGIEVDEQENDKISEEKILREEINIEPRNEDNKQEKTTGILEVGKYLRVGTADNPISLEEDSDSASDYEDANLGLLGEDVPIIDSDLSISKPITSKPKSLNNEETHDLSKNEATPELTSSIGKREFLKPFFAPLHSEVAHKDSPNEPLDIILRQLSRVDSPTKKSFATPNSKIGPGISTPTSSSHRKPSPLRFNLSPLNSRKRQSSSIIPDTPLRKKPSPVKIERQNSTFLMDELSTFEDSD